MSEENDKTIQSYDAGADVYIKAMPQTVSAETRAWIDESLLNISRGARIFEIGSGDGRDAHYIESLGFEVECSDAAPAFVTHLLEKGFSAHQHNVARDPVMGSYDLIYANNVFNHLTPEDAAAAIRFILPALKMRGRMAFSVRAGTGSAWISELIPGPRFVRYWSRQEAENMVREAGFQHWQITGDISTISTKRPWLRVIAYK